MLDLLNEISEMVYVVDLENHDLLYMNTAGRKSFDAKEFEGKKCYHVIRHRETPCEECPNKELRQRILCHGTLQILLQASIMPLKANRQNGRDGPPV